MNTIDKPFQVAFVVKQKNGALYKAIKERGWTHKVAAEFLGIPVHCLSGVINMRHKPPKFCNRKDGAPKLKNFKERLMELTGKSFEDLFPDEIYANDNVMKSVRSVDFFVERDLATLKLEPGSDSRLLTLPESSLESAHYEEIISMMKRILTDLEWRVLEGRYIKGMTLDEVGDREQFCRERIRQIEREALTNLRKHKHILSVLKGDEDVELNASLGISGFDTLVRFASIRTR